MTTDPLAIGRYLLHREIARGGMATVHLARLIGDEGFTRIVAAKRLHPQLAGDESFLAMFLAEARIASKLRHPNIVPVLDVVTSDGQVVLVQEFVHGAPLHWLLDRARLEGRRVPLEISIAIACQVLSGLHAAHVLTDEVGQPLGIVHRDVSPQNVMIATDGTARLLDFGVATTTSTPMEGRSYEGKIAYSAPEQLRGAALPQSDVYSLAVMLWELLVGQRMHDPSSESELVVSVLSGARPHMRETLWKKASSIPSAVWAQLELLEPIVERGLALSIADRWNTAEELELALRAVVRPAPANAVAHWLKLHGRDYLELHERAISAEESSWRARLPRRAVGSTPPDSATRAEHSALRLLPPVGARAPRGSMTNVPSTLLPSTSTTLPLPAPAVEVQRDRSPPRPPRKETLAKTPSNAQDATPSSPHDPHGALPSSPQDPRGRAPRTSKAHDPRGRAAMPLTARGSHEHAALSPEWRGNGGPASPVPEWRGHGAVLAVLGALIVAALLGIVLVVRSSTQHAAAPSLLPASEPVQGFISRPGPRPPAAPPQREGRSATRASRPASAATAVVHPAPGVASSAAEPARLDGATSGADTTRPTLGATASPTKTAREPAPSRPTARAAVRGPAVRTVAKPRPEAVPAKVETKPAADTVDCTPPYYYEGAKKHFKPACL